MAITIPRNLLISGKISRLVFLTTIKFLILPDYGHFLIPAFQTITDPARIDALSDKARPNPDMPHRFLFLLLCLFCLTGNPVMAAENSRIRLGVLAFGTVNWELTALQQARLLDPRLLQIQKLASPQAGKIALQSGSVDMIVSDWIWVSRQRNAGSDFTFYPYSTTAGALVVPAGSPIQGVQDLQKIRLGIAGGELDKNWLLLQALAARKYRLDLNQSLEKVYGAPPLLNQQLLQGRVDAVINYWHYAARLEAQGYRQIIDGHGILGELGIPVKVPTLGYVFEAGWGETHRQALRQFFQATRQARDLLCTSDSAWQQIQPLVKADDPDTRKLLRHRYCAGRISSWGAAEQKAAGEIYRLLKTHSGGRLTGAAAGLSPGTFWEQ